MKKFYFLSVFCFWVIASLYAQPTITYNGNAPQIGDVFYQSFTDDALDPGPAGANQSWNFSSVNVTETKVSYAVDPSVTPFAGDFPESNIAFDYSADNIYHYANISNTEFFNNGTGFDETPPLIIHNTDPSLQMQYPFSYNDNFIDTYFAAYEFEGLLTHQRGTSDVTADAWGSITTPEGTYNVLRVKTIRDHIDSVWMSGIFIYTTSTLFTDYGWYTDNSRIPVFALTIIESALTTDTTGYYSTQSIGIPEQVPAFTNLKIYPNPACDHISVCFTNNQTEDINIQTFNQLGQEVKSLTKNPGFTKDQNLNINLEALQPGVYFIRLSDETSNGSIQKFIKR